MPEPMIVRAMTRLCQAAGVPRINAHGLRHTAASLAFSRGATVVEVQDMLGHSSAVTTMTVYAHLVQHDGALHALVGALREDENGQPWTPAGKSRIGSNQAST